MVWHSHSLYSLYTPSSLPPLLIIFILLASCITLRRSFIYCCMCISFSLVSFVHTYIYIFICQVLAPPFLQFQNEWFGVVYVRNVFIIADKQSEWRRGLWIMRKNDPIIMTALNKMQFSTQIPFQPWWRKWKKKVFFVHETSSTWYFSWNL